MKRNKKKLKKIIANVMLYTICWRNVDKHDDIWVYDSYNVELKEGKMEEFIKNNFWYIVGFFTIPTIKLFIKIISCTIKSTKHKKITKKVKNNK